MHRLRRPVEDTSSCFARSLKNVIFVNPLKELGNYLFESCDALELVWYPNTLDSVGIQCFSQSMIDALVIDAKRRLIIMHLQGAII